MSETPSGRSSPTSTGRSSPTNDASDDPAAAISRIASLFQSLNRLRDAGYGTSVIAAKVAECRAAVVSLPPDLQAKVDGEILKWKSKATSKVHRDMKRHKKHIKKQKKRAQMIGACVDIQRRFDYVFFKRRSRRYQKRYQNA